MLILERKIDERIYIGDDVFVMVCAVDPITRKVKLGISAPPDVIVDRSEIRDRRREGRS